MKVAIIGAGGIGGFLGARLAEAGEDVTLVARGAHLAAIREHGLILRTPHEEVRATSATAVDDPAAIGPVDVVVVGVKMWDLETALRSVLPIVGPHTIVVGFQNGLEKETIAARIVGREHVVAGVCYIAAEIERPGVVLQKGEIQRFIVGEIEGPPSERVTALCRSWTKAGINAETSDDMARTIWEKLVFLASHAGLTTLLRLPIGPIRENPQSRSLLLDSMRESVAVARAAGVRLPDDFAEQRLTFIDTQPPTFRASMAVDLARGNRLEVDWLSGAIARLGRELGVPTPVHRVIADALAPFANGRPPEAG